MSKYFKVAIGVKKKGYQSKTYHALVYAKNTEEAVKASKDLISESVEKQLVKDVKDGDGYEIKVLNSHQLVVDFVINLVDKPITKPTRKPRAKKST